MITPAELLSSIGVLDEPNHKRRFKSILLLGPPGSGKGVQGDILMSIPGFRPPLRPSTPPSPSSAFCAVLARMARATGLRKRPGGTIRAPHRAGNVMPPTEDGRNKCKR